MVIAQAYGIEYIGELEQGIQHMPFKTAGNCQADDRRGHSDAYWDPGTSCAESLRFQVSTDHGPPVNRRQFLQGLQDSPDSTVIACEWGIDLSRDTLLPQ